MFNILTAIVNYCALEVQKKRDDELGYQPYVCIKSRERIYIVGCNSCTSEQERIHINLYILLLDNQRL